MADFAYYIHLRNLTLLVFIAGYLPTCSAMFSLFESTDNNSVGCLPEQYDVNKFYLFKANAAPIVMKGRVNVSSLLNGQMNSFTIREPEIFKGIDEFTTGELNNLESLLGKDVFYVNILKSPCEEMRKFKKFSPNKEYFFFLSKASEPDHFALFKNSTVEVPTLTFFAQPDVYKLKVEKTIREDLFCESCMETAPFVDKYWSSSYYLTEGDDFSLKCKLQGTPLPFNYFTLNGTAFDTNYQNGRTTVVTKGRKAILRISDVQKSDEGVYQCIGTNFLDEDASLSTNLFVNQVQQEATSPDTSAFPSTIPWPFPTKVPSSLTCPDHYKGFCLNGGECFWLRESDVIGCKCVGYYQGERCQDYIHPSKLVSVRSDNSRFWTITTFAILSVAFVFALLYSARLYFRVRRLKRALYDREIESPLSVGFPVDYDAPPIPKRYSGAREISFQALERFETKPNDVFFSNWPNGRNLSPRREKPSRYLPVNTPPILRNNPSYTRPDPGKPDEQPVSHNQTFPKRIKPSNNRQRLSEEPMDSSMGSPETKPTNEKSPDDSKLLEPYTYPRDSLPPTLPPNFYELNKTAKETDIVDSKSDFHDYSVPNRSKSLENEKSEDHYSEV